MYMVMVMIANQSHLTLIISANLLVIEIMVIAMRIAMMPEMGGSMIRRVFQRIADTHRCRVGGIQREHDGKNKRETSAHNGEV